MTQTYTLSIIVITINPESARARPWETTFYVLWDAIDPPAGADDYEDERIPLDPWTEYDRLTITATAGVLWSSIGYAGPAIGTVEVQAAQPPEDVQLRMLGPDVAGLMTFVSAHMSGPLLVGEVGQRTFTARPLASDEPPEPPKLAA